MHKENPRAKVWESSVRKSQFPRHHRRRRGLNFYSMSVVPTTDDEDTDRADRSPTATTSEKFLPNGDFYTGEWRNDVPHGIGKYLWLDGCMYEGEWRNGKTMGKGKFSWPSGATYEGDFKLEFMNGYGTYIGSNGDTYKGGWAMNLKNGKGTKNYANGDWYDGEWKNGVQDGHGRYVWKNGNEYEGEWRNGVIHGSGSLIWANGNRYHGGWEKGMPMGEGTFRWEDGAMYVGVWGKGSDGEQKGTYYPSLVSSSPTARDPHVMFDLELAGCKICPGEMVSILPSQKRLNLVGGSDAPKPRQKGSVDTSTARVMRPNGGPWTHKVKGSNGGESGFDGICIWDSDGDITCDIVDGSRIMTSRSSTDSSISEENRFLRSEQQTMTTTLPNAMKKQGEIIKKGHKNYELMLNLQLGIRHAVGRQAAQAATLDLKSSAFDPKEKVWTRFPPEGSKYTPPHQSCEFRWKDYCPVVFRTLRRLFKVDAAEYMLSICGDNALRELSSPGKSGSFFYLTNDDKYMIKTLKKAEVKVLLRMLPAYYKHVRSYENTLLTKFFGLHCVKLTGTAQKKVRFVIMGNLFCSQYIIHRRFDLKGSSHGRTTNKSESEIDANTTLKDLDLSYIFRLHKSWFQEFCRQVDRDCDILEQERIMDYSLLVGLHFRERRDTTSNEGNIKYSKETAPPRVDMHQSLLDQTRLSTLKLGINMPARVEKTIRINENELIGERTGNIYEVVLFFGIIDILQDYDISKKLEHAYKAFQYDATSISAVDPKLYSRRFKEFIFKAFIEDT